MKKVKFRAVISNESYEGESQTVEKAKERAWDFVNDYLEDYSDEDWYYHGRPFIKIEINAPGEPPSVEEFVAYIDEKGDVRVVDVYEYEPPETDYFDWCYHDDLRGFDDK